jgi:hypothetical protein
MRVALKLCAGAAQQCGIYHSHVLHSAAAVCGACVTECDVQDVTRTAEARHPCRCLGLCSDIGEHHCLCSTDTVLDSRPAALP